MSQPIARYGIISGMIETANNLAKDYAITREECDAYAALSHQRATAAWAAGKFDDELVPVAVPQRKGDPVIFAMTRASARTPPETLARLKPSRKTAW
jgi:acetyl-CoA C-acetyltransferase